MTKSKISLKFLNGDNEVEVLYIHGCSMSAFEVFSLKTNKKTALSKV